MPRPFIPRRVRFQPGVTFFKPAGIQMAGLNEVVLTMGEFEAVRLKDFEDMDQTPSAKKMNISQPTFARLLDTARKKIADALVNGKAIKIEGGTYKMVQQPMQPGMGRGAGMGRGRGAGGRGMGFGGPAVTCVCTACGHQAPKQRGIPCSTLKCPKCGAPMVRGQ